MQSAIDGQRSDIRVLIVGDSADPARALTLQLERCGAPVVHERVACA